VCFSRASLPCHSQQDRPLPGPLESEYNGKNRLYLRKLEVQSIFREAKKGNLVNGGDRRRNPILRRGSWCSYRKACDIVDRVLETAGTFDGGYPQNDDTGSVLAAGRRVRRAPASLFGIDDMDGRLCVDQRVWLQIRRRDRTEAVAVWFRAGAG